MESNVKQSMKSQFNVFFITEEDPFYIYLFFEVFFEKFDLDKVQIKGIAILNPFNKKSTWALIKQMYGFFGPVDFIRTGFSYLGKKLSGMSVRKLAQKFFIPIIDVRNVNDPEFLDKLREMKLDLIISVAAPQKFKKELLELPCWDCINIHSGKLPKYRGMMPSFWTLFENEKYGAITIHRMNEDLDDGEIILQQDVEVGSNETLDSYIRKTKRLGAEMMIEAVRQITNGEAVLKPNDRNESMYFTFPTPEEVKEFRRKGRKLL